MEKKGKKVKRKGYKVAYAFKSEVVEQHRWVFNKKLFFSFCDLNHDVFVTCYNYLLK